jgi:hypothetical protein
MTLRPSPRPVSGGKGQSRKVVLDGAARENLLIGISRPTSATHAEAPALRRSTSLGYNHSSKYR